MVSNLAVKETQFAEQLKKFLDGSDDGLRPIRERAFRYFEENGYPSVREENWKYTNVTPIAKVDWTVERVAV
jgi:Fe-S cluster assembly protein SufD